MCWNSSNKACLTGGLSCASDEASILKLVRTWKRNKLVHNVKKLAATDATAKNPMQATDATATPTDVLLGFVMRTLLVVIAVKTYNLVTTNNCQ